MTTPAMPELLREIVAYCREAGHDWSSLAEADHMLATLSSQPSPELAGVSDERGLLQEFLDAYDSLSPHFDAEAWAERVRAILALRPQAVPMTDEQANGYWKIAAKASSRYSPAEAYYKGIADTEAHHGITVSSDITAQGAQGEQA